MSFEKVKEVVKSCVGIPKTRNYKDIGKAKKKDHINTCITNTHSLRLEGGECKLKIEERRYLV